MMCIVSVSLNFQYYFAGTVLISPFQMLTSVYRVVHVTKSVLTQTGDSTAHVIQDSPWPLTGDLVKVCVQIHVHVVCS